MNRRLTLIACILTILIGIQVGYAQNNSKHSVEVDFHLFNGRYSNKIAQSAGIGTTLSSSIRHPDFVQVYGISYTYAFNSKWGISTSVSYTDFVPVLLGFSFDTPYTFTDVAGTTFSGFDNYSTSHVHSVFVDIGPVWTMIDSRDLKIKSKLSVGLLGNDLTIQDDLDVFYTSAAGSPVRVNVGRFDIQQKNFYKGFGTMELLGELNVGPHGLFMSGGVWYRIFFDSITDDSSVLLIDGAGNESTFQFKSGMQQLGLRVGMGIRF